MRRRRMINGREVLFEGGPGISTAVYRERGLGYASPRTSTRTP